MHERMMREVKAAMDEKLPNELEKIALEKFRREFSRQTCHFWFGTAKFLAVAASIGILLGIGFLTYQEKEFYAPAQESDASIMLEIVGMENISDFYGNFIDETRIDGNINF
jgi:hypothetical protein